MKMKSVKNKKIEGLKKKIQYVLAYNGSAPGQIFDGRTYAGCVRFIVFSFLVIYVGGHADDIGRWIWHQFGETLTASPGKEAWHRVVALGMGTVGIVIGLIDIYKIYTSRSKKIALPPSPSEETLASAQVDTVDSMGSSTKQLHAESEISHSQKRDD
jgi:hypothetical protein